MNFRTSNIYAPTGYVEQDEHEALMGQKGVCIWLTGLSASGKTSIARTLQHLLFERQIKTYALDGDIVRSGLSSDLPFTQEGRAEHIRRVQEVARMFCDAGLVVICAFISPSREMREACRQRFAKGRFIECYVSCALDTCIERDPKGLYRRAKEGLIPNFTGISAPYEPPEHPELVLRSDQHSPMHCAELILDYLSSHTLIASS